MIHEPSRILVVEDDLAIRRGIVDSLRFSDYQVIETADGDEAVDLALREPVDLVLLDWVLPKSNGLEVLQQVRDRKPTLPVIMLTARGVEKDRVAGLRAGADDYVVKPFSIQELLARVEAVLRRSPQRVDQNDVVELPTGTIDFVRQEFSDGDGEAVELSERECELLRYLIENANRIVGRSELLENVWRLDPRGLSTRTVDMHVARLREKLGDDSSAPRVLTTVRGKGYKFAVATANPST